MTDDDVRSIITTAESGDRIVAAALLVLHGFTPSWKAYRRNERKRRDRVREAPREACKKWLAAR